jgi:hypothetical protein
MWPVRGAQATGGGSLDKARSSARARAGERGTDSLGHLIRAVPVQRACHVLLRWAG